MGTSIAYFLATSTDRDVTILEKSTVAAGSTGDSSANIRHNYGDRRIYTRMARWSQDFYRDFEARTGSPLAYTPTTRMRFGKHGTDEGAFVEAGYEVMQDLGVPSTWHDAADLGSAFPMFDDVDQYDFAVTEDDTAYSDGTDAARGFVDAATDRGATLVTDTEVEGFETHRGRVDAVVTDRGRVDCTEVVLAAGPWTPTLAARMDIDVPVAPTRADVLLLDPPPAFEREHLPALPMTRFFGGELYLRPDGPDRVLVGTHPLDPDPLDPDGAVGGPDEATMLRVTDAMGRHMSGLADAEIGSAYSGIYSMTPDHDFVLDRAGPDGCYVAAGFSGHGFKHAPAIGRMLTDLVVDGESDLADLGIFSLSRFGDGAGHGRPDDPL
jgi:glycine/D-amino acid oxidase-like deaminating enzyme